MAQLLLITAYLNRARQKLYTSHSSIVWISLCRRISMATVYEHNNLFLLVLKWRKPLRNHIKRTAKKTCRPEFVACRSQKRLAGCMSCASKKRNKCWSFPHWWLISTHTQQSSKNRHISSLFPTALARRKGIFFGCGWWHASVGKWRSTTSQSLLVSVLSVCVGDSSRCLRFWRVSCFPSPVSFTISIHSTAGGFYGVEE